MRIAILTAKRFLKGRALRWTAVAVFARFAERILWVIAALGLAAHGRWPAISAAGAAAAWFARGVARSASAQQLRETIATDLARAPFEDCSAPPSYDASEREAMIFDSRYVAEQVLTTHLPALLAEPLACVVLVMLAGAARPALFLVALATAASLLLSHLVRRVSERGTEKAWMLNVQVSHGILTSFAARSELLANGADQRHLASVGTLIRGWSARARSEEVRAAMGERVPALLLACMVAIWMRSERYHLSDVPLLAAFVAPVASLARASLEMRRAEPQLLALAAVLPTVKAPCAAIGTQVVDLPCPISFRSVSFGYAAEATAAGTPKGIHNLSFEWERGAVLLISGPNGAGKTTVLKLLAGLLQPQSGMIDVGGKNLSLMKLDAWRADIAYLAQNPYTTASQTVRDAMRLLAPQSSTEDYRRYLGKVQIWGLLAHRNAADPMAVRLGLLSAGERQRVFIARALAKQAPLVLLDEPDEGLDEAGKCLLNSLLIEVAATAMVAVVSHDEDAYTPPHCLQLRI